MQSTTDDASLWTLALELNQHSRRTNNLDDLNRAIEALHKTIQATPCKHPQRGFRLMELAATLNRRHTRSRQINDLDDALSYGQQAVEAVPKRHPMRVTFLRDLGVGLQSRFRRRGQIADLDQAIKYFEQAMATSEELDGPDKGMFIASFAGGLHYKYQRTKEPECLMMSIHHLRKALKCPSVDPYWRRDLGIALRDLYESKKEEKHLREAIECFQQAADAFSENGNSPNAKSDKANCLRELGVGYAVLWRDTGDETNLKRAISHFRHAITIFPERNPELGGCTQNLAEGLEDLHRATQNKEFRSQATTEYVKVLRNPFAFPIARLSCGVRALCHFLEDSQWQEGAGLTDDIIQTIPEITPHISARADLEYSLRNVSGVGGLITSVLLKVKRSPIDALQALESCRGLIAGQMMDERWDTSTLKKDHPQLWVRYTDCQNRISELVSEGKMVSSIGDRRSHVEISNDRLQCHKQLTDLRNEIRQCPGFEGFLLDLTETDIRKMAHEGPLVSFNVSTLSSEALLITTNGVTILRLPLLRRADIRQFLQETARRGNPSRRDGELYEANNLESSTTHDFRLSEELLSLWTNAVRPVLDHLQVLDHGASTGKLPRVWWVGGGLMGAIPLHAAGDHTPGSRENTISHVISSYVPSLKALQFIQSQPEGSFNNASSKQEILIVSMPDTPGQYQPLNVSEEVAMIQRSSASWAATSTLIRPDRQSVVDALGSCTIAHFACHAIADNLQPAKSSLILGCNVEERLTLEDLDLFNHRKAQMAYLSACSTAEVKVRNLLDESIHLASAFQLAGFSHVIGTLWGADDDAAVQIAKGFYEGLQQYRNDGRDSVARALHGSILSYRNQGKQSLAILKWAPFIHLGC